MNERGRSGQSDVQSDYERECIKRRMPWTINNISITKLVPFLWWFCCFVSLFFAVAAAAACLQPEDEKVKTTRTRSECQIVRLKTLANIKTDTYTRIYSFNSHILWWRLLLWVFIVIYVCSNLIYYYNNKRIC